MGSTAPRLLAFLLVATPVLAQAAESATEIAERVRSGGWFEAAPRHQRGVDGSLQHWYFADAGAGPDLGKFVPIVPLADKDLFGSLGALGLLALVCHGPGDLLGMTDTGFHFRALGSSDEEVALRQLVASAFEAEGVVGCAELLDRHLAVATLLRRGSPGAVVELRKLVELGKLPPALGDSVRQQLALHGEGGGALRRRFDPKALLVPATYDACVLVDHARLPDMSFVTALARRTGALVTAAAIGRAGGNLSAATCNGAQFWIDRPAEAPFELVRQFGNARLDQSCVFLHTKTGPGLPVDLSWQAAGEIAAEGWNRADIDRVLRSSFADCKVTFAPDGLLLTTRGEAGIVREAKATELLNDTGAAIRVVVPGTSKLLAMIAFLGLPPATGLEVRVTFGDPTTVAVVVEARDEDAAAAWAAKGKGLLASLPAQLEQPTAAVAACEAWRELIGALAHVEITVHEAQVTMSVPVRGFTAAKCAAIVEAFAVGG